MLCIQFLLFYMVIWEFSQIIPVSVDFFIINSFCVLAVKFALETQWVLLSLDFQSP